MTWFYDNWYIVIGMGALGGALVYYGYKFYKLPTAQQISTIKEWLKYAVVEAEKELGSGTGQIKLRYVYNMAITKFKWLSFISFDTFSAWVDEALETMNEWLSENDKIKDYVSK